MSGLSKVKTFKILWHYIKDDKLRLFGYIVLVAVSYLPSLFAAVLWGVLIEALTEGHFDQFVFYLAIYEGIYILLFSILQIPRDYLYNYLEIKFMRNVSKDLYCKIDNLPAIAFEDIGVGEFINRLYTDPDRVIELLSKMVRLICRALVVLVVLVICFRVSFLLGMEIILLIVIMGFISWKFFPKIKKSNEEIKKQSDKYVKDATENITGIREVKALGIKKNVEQRVFKVLDGMYLSQSNAARYERWYWAFNNVAYYLLQFVIFFTSGKYYIDGIITLGVFMMLESYIWRIDEVVESISDFGVNFNKVSVSLKRIDEIVHNRLYEDEKFGDVELQKARGKIEFKDVKFRYRDEEKYTLNGLSLVFEPHKKIAVVGRSGNGKSTIFNLLLRYFDATEGQILIDGVPLQNLTEASLRQNISIIRQSPFLFNLSIMDNFRLVREDVTLEEVRTVCQKAYIDEYIMSLPEQYETVIGEGGINLSGGQKQRIAIARTLLLQTKIILFDEATSALDNESQEYIKKTIDELVSDHTVIIVAHRLSTIVDADRIYVIDKGILAGSGTHKALLENNEVYRSLYFTENANSSE